MVTKKRLREQLEIANFVILVYEKRYSQLKEKHDILFANYNKVLADKIKWEEIARKLDRMRLEKLSGTGTERI